MELLREIIRNGLPGKTGHDVLYLGYLKLQGHGFSHVAAI